MKLSGLEILTVGDERKVLFCRVELASFNVISDDYAYTHASEFAHLFQDAYLANGMDRIPMDKRVEDASNKAFSKL